MLYYYCYFGKADFFTCLHVQRPHKANGEEMTKYHSDDYIKFLRSIRPDNMSEYSKQMQRCKLMICVPCSRCSNVRSEKGASLWTCFCVLNVQ